MAGATPESGAQQKGPADWGLPDAAVNSIRQVLARFPEVERAVLYGSRAKRTHREGSDIDLTLLGDRLTQKVLGEIDLALDDLLLPYMIDLSIFSEIEHVALREHIHRVGMVFYERNKKSESFVKD